MDGSIDYKKYSTEEHWTGKYWIDGKKIYSVSYYFSGNANGDHNVQRPDIDRLIKVEGTYCRDSATGTCRPFDGINGAGFGACLNVNAYNTSTAFINIEASVTAYNAVVNLKYTKITD